MTKNGKRGYIILAVVFIVWSLVAFAPPFSKTAVFWFAYLFGVVSIAFQIYVFKIAFDKGDDAKSRFYGFPIAKIGIAYLGVQLLISLIELIVAAFLLTWVALLINAIVLALAFVGCIAAETMRDEIEKQDTGLKKDVANMRALQSLSASIASQCTIDELKKDLNKVAEEFKYSDPVTSDQTKEIEEDLKQQMNEIQSAVLEGDAEGAKTLCAKILAGLAERNSVCALNK